MRPRFTFASTARRWPCFYGIDTDVQSQLISAKKNVDEVREYIEADSLAFLSLEGLLKCVPANGYCAACYNGKYPVEIPKSFSAGKFLEGYEPENLSRASRGSQMGILEVAKDEAEEG